MPLPQSRPQLNQKAIKVGNEVQGLMDSLQKGMQQLTQQHNRLTSAAKSVDLKTSKASRDDIRRTIDQVQKTLERYEKSVKALVEGVDESLKEHEKKVKVQGSTRS